MKKATACVKINKLLDAAEVVFLSGGEDAFARVGGEYELSPVEA